MNKTVTKCSNKVKFLYRNARNFDKKTKTLLVSALDSMSFRLRLYVMQGIVDLRRNQSSGYKWPKTRLSGLC